MFAHETYKTVPRDERRRVIEQGWLQFGLTGWAVDPPYAGSDPRWWLFMNGSEAAERCHQGRGGTKERVQGWH